MPYTIDEIREIVNPIAKQYGVESVGLFGAYARGEANEKSDLDFVIRKGNLKGLLSYCGFIDDLETAFSCHVDVVTRSAINDKQFSNEIDRDEVNIYEHDYERIDNDMIWETITDDIPAIRKKLVAVLEECEKRALGE